MWAHIGLPLGPTPNTESRLEAIMEIYPWAYFHFWLIFGTSNHLFWDPNFSPPCGQLAAPYLYVDEESRPNCKVGRSVSSGGRDASFDDAGGRYYQGEACPSHCPRSGPLELLLQALWTAVLPPSAPGVPAGKVSPHVRVGRVTCPPPWGSSSAALPSRVEYLSPHGVLLPRVYGMIASPLLLELQGPAAWQATPSWAVYRLACHRLLPWLRMTFTMVTNAARPGLDQWPWR